MKQRNENFGIHMKNYCREHEAFITSAEPTKELLLFHEKKIEWIQHERFVHLIVTVMVVIAELLVVFLVVVHPELGFIPPILMLGLAVLLGFYFYHYFFLENTVQRWYKIYDSMVEKLQLL